ncbi:MAG: GNAT family N-acetyltransferase [Candidatus Bathyarchaeota archaeon]|nr:GNAT family N-acetyltransferase [Candidatus Bathyarchaeota archaeon]
MSTPDQVSIVGATEEEIHWLTEVCKRAYDNDPEITEHQAAPKGYDKPKKHMNYMEYNDYQRIVLDDLTAGALIIANRGEHIKELVQVYVEPEYQRQGVATKAIRLVMEKYPEVKIWTAAAPEWSTAATGLLEKLEFSQEGVVTGSDKWLTNWYQRASGEAPSKPKIAELSEGMKNITVEGEILEKAYARQVRSKRRYETLTVAETGFSDKSGRLVLTLWNEQIKLVNVGDKVRVINGYVTSYRGITQLNVGRSGRLVKLI